MGLRFSNNSSQPCGLGDDGTNSWNGLSLKEKQALRKTMKKLQETSSENGQQLFFRFFQAYPTYKNLFKPFRHMDVDQLRNSFVLRAHGTMVIHTLAGIIEKIDDYHLFRTTLHTSVRSHFEKGVRIQNYEAMFEVFTAFLLEKFSIMDPLTLGAWNKLAHMVLECIQDYMRHQGMMARSRNDEIGRRQDIIEDS